MQTSNTFVSTRETDLAPAVNCHNHVLGGFVLFPRPREDILAGICWCNPHHSSLRMRETLIDDDDDDVYYYIRWRLKPILSFFSFFQSLGKLLRQEEAEE